MKFLKYIKVALLPAMLVGSAGLPGLSAQTPDVGEGELVYKVQVGAYADPSAFDVEKLQGMGTVYFEEGVDGMSRIVLGYFKTRDEADPVLDKVLEAGYGDAFVKSGKPGKAVAQAEPAQPQPQPPAKEVVKETVKVAETALQPGEVYMVNLGKFKQLSEAPNLVPFLELGKIYSGAVNDSIFLMLGAFGSLEDADAALAKVWGSGLKSASLKKVQSEAPPAKTEAAAEKPATFSTPTTTQPSGSLTMPSGSSSAASGGAMLEMSDLAADVVVAAPAADLVPYATQDFRNFDALFARIPSVPMRNIQSYDPSIKTGGAITYDNDLLKGKTIPPYLVYVFDNSPDRDLAYGYNALYKYSMSPTHDAYVVRAGKGDYHKDNVVLLYVFDRARNKFTARQELSSIDADTFNNFAKTQSWLTDLNGDGINDVLSYNLQEAYNPMSNTFEKSEKFTAKVWLDGKFVDGQVRNQPELKTKLGL